MAMAVITMVATRAVAVVHAVKVRISVPRYSTHDIVFLLYLFHSLFVSFSLYPLFCTQFDALPPLEIVSFFFFILPILT